MSKTIIPRCIAAKIDFDKVHSQEDLNTAIGQAYDACAKESGKHIKAMCDCDKGKGEKKKREPSAYNNFIKSCFQEKPNPTLKDCAADWRKKKTEG